MKLKYKNIYILFLILPIFIANNICAKEPSRIGVVDMQFILNESKAGKIAKSKIDIRGKKMEETLKKEANAINELQEILKQKAMAMNKHTIEHEERKLRIMINDLKSLQQKFERELNELQGNLFRHIGNTIINIITEIANTEEYSIIIDKLAVPYSPKKIDITNKVLKKYNNMYNEN